jgi:hypothetical protein
MMRLLSFGTILTCFFFPTASGAVHCTMTDPIVVDRKGEVMLQQYLNEEERTLTMKMTYTGGKAWVGVGINEAGKAQMTPATVVIGWGSPDGSATVPMTYSLSSKAPDTSGVILIPSQTLQNAIFEQTDTTSTLTFVRIISIVATLY